MNRLKTTLLCVSFLALLMLLVGCVSVTQPPFRASFLPPTPPKSAAPAFVTPEPPVIEPKVDVKSNAHADMAQALQSSQAETLARDADWHYQAGRRAYQEGDDRRARQEFDRAIDLLLTAPEDPRLRPVIEKKLDELVAAIHRLDLAGLGAGETGEPRFEKPPLEDLPQLTFPVDPKLKNKVLEEVRATVSQLPLEVNDAVLSYINYFSSERGHRILVTGMRRAGRYKPLIQRIFDEEGVPQELIFLGQAESGFLPRAVSRKKATGMWQFVQFRGREYGLMQSAYADERLDPEKATRAAARHLRDLYQRYGDWYLAIAAYNCGPGVVDRAVERTGYADFWELRRRNTLPKETANYVPIILAMTIMAKNSAEYRLNDIDPDPAQESDTVEITAATTLQLAADLSECPVSQLQQLNPALLKNIAPAGWMLRVPRPTGAQVAALLGMVPPEKRASWRAHRVVDGDSLLSIARRYRVTANSLASANPALDGTLEPGELVIVPAAPVALKVKAPVKRAARPRTTTRRTAARSSAKTPARASVGREKPVAQVSSTRSHRPAVRR